MAKNSTNYDVVAVVAEDYQPREKKPRRILTPEEINDKREYNKRNLIASVQAYNSMLGYPAVTQSFLSAVPTAILRQLYREYKKRYIKMQKEEIRALDCGELGPICRE